MGENKFKVIEEVMKRQIELDATLRKAKDWLRCHSDDGGKWDKLKHTLY